MDEFVHFAFKIAKSFPKEEIFSTTSQFKRAALSVILNYIEGIARRKLAVQLNFFEISYGSFKESKYLLHFTYKEEWISVDNYNFGLQLAEEIGAMLWSEIMSVEKEIENKKC